MTATVICFPGTFTMKFQVGYQNNRKFTDYLLNHGEMVSELYFPWGSFTTGRGVTLEQEQLENDLALFADAGFKFCLLLNGNCYGKDALSKTFFHRLAASVGEISERFGLHSVTTASPVIAGFLRREFPALHLRASVNMEIGTPEAVEYMLENFDSFYLKREYNYDLSRIIRMRDFCHARGKKLYILANSGCLNFCSARTFHDNLVAHQHEISPDSDLIDFHGQCTVFLGQGENRKNILAQSNFIRPEDVKYFENLCDGMKLATRTNFNPMGVAFSYFNGRTNGNLLDLTEPAHSALLPGKIISSRKFPADYADRRFACDKVCEECGYCRDVQEKSTIVL